MLFEYRAYTLRPGNEDAFWDAQLMRGLDPVKRPIMARVVGYFATRTGPVDQIVHLWRFDSYEDWYVDENVRTVHANIETATFPNLIGAPNQRRIVTAISADELRFTNPRTPAGVTLEFVWRTAK
jgi:hypothetical protein